MIFVAPLTGKFQDKYGPLFPIASGLILVTLSLFWFLVNIGSNNLYLLLSALLPFGVGIPLVTTPCTSTGISSVPQPMRGTATGTAAMLRLFALTLGFAIMGSLILTVRYHSLQTSLQSVQVAKSFDSHSLDGLLSNTPSAVKALGELPKNVQAIIRADYMQAYLRGFRLVNLISLIVAASSAVLSVYFFRKKRLESCRSQDEES